MSLVWSGGTAGSMSEWWTTRTPAGLERGEGRRLHLVLPAEVDDERDAALLDQVHDVVGSTSASESLRYTCPCADAARSGVA